MARLTFLNRHSVEQFDIKQKGLKKRFSKFSVFVVVALLIVAIIVGSMFYFNYKNNSIYMFMDASTAAFKSGSFDYRITTRVNSENCMVYEGSLSADISKQTMSSLYHATYEDYEYDCALYCTSRRSCDGVLYGGKWTINDYTSQALDFFDFFRSFDNKQFNAAAFMRYVGNTKTFDSSELENAVSDIFEDLSSSGNIKTVMNEKITYENDNTIVTFSPQLDMVADIIVEHIAPAYSSANEFAQFKELINVNRENLKKAKCDISYTINGDGYLTDLIISYNVNHKNYLITCELSNFENTTVELPDSFFIAANSQT